MTLSNTVNYSQRRDFRQSHNDPQSLNEIPESNTFDHAIPIDGGVETPAPKPADIECLARSMTSESSKDSTIPAGYTYLGQFLLHDVSFDLTPLSASGRNGSVSNSRTPRFDLDSVYGRGQRVEPYLQDKYEPAKFAMGRTLGGEYPNDLVRCPQGFAVIPDPRNDENLVVAQMHVAFMHFHNRMVDSFYKEGLNDPREVYKAARSEVVWHYQQMIVDDYLPRVICPAVLNCPKRAWLSVVRKDGSIYVPFEFAHAAFRFGHSMIREEYQFNRVFQHATLRSLMRLTGNHPHAMTVPLPENWVIDWRRFFEFPYSPIPLNFARRIDSQYSLELAKLPPPVNSLAKADLERAQNRGVCSGQRAAGHFKMKVLSSSELGVNGAFTDNTPLLYYILREAEREKGECLGELGSRIVYGTMHGLLAADGESVLHQKKNGWKPRIHNRKRVTMADILTFAQIVNPLGDKPVS